MDITALLETLPVSLKNSVIDFAPVHTKVYGEVILVRTDRLLTDEESMELRECERIATYGVIQKKNGTPPNNAFIAVEL